MLTPFFKAADGWCADFIPFYWDGKFRLFYLLSRPNDAETGIPWELVETSDFVHFDPIGVMLPSGGPQAQDHYVFTGSVIRAEGRFHIFYTGHNSHLRAQGLPEQKVMHAVSDDLHHWEKLPDHTFQAADGFEIHDWRDPFVYWDEEARRYQMLLAARLTGGNECARGCTVRLNSTDLVQWTVEKTIFAPNAYFAHECPDLFKMGDWYYLIFSEFNDVFRTRYVMSRNPDGPWIAPRNDVFDNRPYYAAKSCSDGEHRYLFGWNADRYDGTDASGFRWGGSLVVHELIQQENGELVCREPESIAASWAPGLQPVTFEGSDAPGTACICSPYGFRTAYAEQAFPEKFRLEADLTFDEAAHDFGLLLRADAKTGEGYALSFRPEEHRVELYAHPAMNHWDFARFGLNRVFHMTPDRPFHLTVTVDGTVMVAYIDDRIAFSARICDLHGSNLGFYAMHGGLQVENVRFATEQK